MAAVGEGQVRTPAAAEPAGSSASAHRDGQTDRHRPATAWARSRGISRLRRINEMKSAGGPDLMTSRVSWSFTLCAAEGGGRGMTPARGRLNPESLGAWAAAAHAAAGV